MKSATIITLSAVATILVPEYRLGEVRYEPLSTMTTK